MKELQILQENEHGGAKRCVLFHAVFFVYIGSEEKPLMAFWVHQYTKELAELRKTIFTLNTHIHNIEYKKY